MFKLEKRDTSRPMLLRTILTMLAAIVLAFAVAALFILAVGGNPITAYGALFEGAFGSTYRRSETLLRMTPLLIMSLGVAIGYRAGMFNMGGEGQFIISIIACTVVYLYIPAGVFTIPLAFLASMLAAGIYAGFPGLMKARVGVSESIINIMLNYIALYWLSRLVNSALKDPNGGMNQSAMIDEAYFFPLLIPNTRLHVGFLLAIAMVVVSYIVLFYLPFGYQLRSTGSNINAARYAGFNVPRLQTLAMFISGAMVGMAGAIEITGVHHRLMEGISANYGWDAIAVALIGNQNPLAIVLSSLLFAALKVGSNTMQTSQGIPNNLVNVLQGLVILFALGSNFFVRYRIRLAKQPIKKSAKGGKTHA